MDDLRKVNEMKCKETSCIQSLSTESCSLGAMLTSHMNTCTAWLRTPFYSKTQLVVPQGQLKIAPSCPLGSPSQPRIWLTVQGVWASLITNYYHQRYEQVTSGLYYLLPLPKGKSQIYSLSFSVVLLKWGGYTIIQHEDHWRESLGIYTKYNVPLYSVFVQLTLESFLYHVIRILQGVKGQSPWIN